MYSCRASCVGPVKDVCIVLPACGRACAIDDGQFEGEERRVSHSTPLQDGGQHATTHTEHSATSWRPGLAILSPPPDQSKMPSLAVAAVVAVVAVVAHVPRIPSFELWELRQEPSDHKVVGQAYEHPRQESRMLWTQAADGRPETKIRRQGLGRCGHPRPAMHVSITSGKGPKTFQQQREEQPDNGKQQGDNRRQ